MLGGTRRREGRRREERTTVRKHRKGHGPCKPVNEMALDSRTGEEEEIFDQRVTDGVASGQDHPPLHHPERISLVRSRMRQLCSTPSSFSPGGNNLLILLGIPPALTYERAIRMALRMAGLKRRKSGAWGSRITIPEDVRADYQALYRKHVNELFYAPADCPSRRAEVLFSEWQAEIKNRIATLRAKQRGGVPRPDAASGSRFGRRMVSLVRRPTRREPRAVAP